MLTIQNNEKINSDFNRNNNKINKVKYLIENRLYKDYSYNIISKKIYKDKNNLKSCRNLDTGLHLKKEKHDKIIFSIFNNAYYPKNNYDLEIFDFKIENTNDSTTKNNNQNNGEEKNNINRDIMNQLKELRNKLKYRLDKIEKEQKNKQKDI